MGFPDQADKQVTANQPDTVVVNKLQKEAAVLGVAILSDCNIRQKDHERLKR